MLETRDETLECDRLPHDTAVWGRASARARRISQGATLSALKNLATNNKLAHGRGRPEHDLQVRQPTWLRLSYLHLIRLQCTIRENLKHIRSSTRLPGANSCVNAARNPPTTAGPVEVIYLI